MKSPEQNEKDVSTGEAINRLVSITAEAFSQGSAAAVQETRLLSQDGTDDINAPVSMVRYVADRLCASLTRIIIRWVII